MTNREDALQMELSASDGAWEPTPHGRWLARMLADNDLVSGKDVLELGAGVANHTILIHRKGARSIVATEITEGLLQTTKENFERNCGEVPNLELRVADWLNTEGEFDLIVTNPPFCKSGKVNRRYYLDSLILEGHKRLRPGGELLFVQSSMADVHRTMTELDRNGFDAREVGRTSGPFRDYYFEDLEFMKEIEEVKDGYFEVEGAKHEWLAVIHAKLRPWSPPASAHVPDELR
ncbi:MAG: methyltransferase [Planctomycetota bacterium]